MSMDSIKIDTPNEESFNEDGSLRTSASVIAKDTEQQVLLLEDVPAENDKEQDEIKPPPFWPVLPKEALYGLSGLVVEAACADSEADPVAVLMTFLAWAGAEFGSAVYFSVGHQKHPPRLFVAIAAKSGRGRKGTSVAPCQAIFEEAERILLTQDPLFLELRRTPGPLSTGEGLVWNVRDASDEISEDTGKPVDPGVADKRLLVVSEELAAGLAAAKRQGSTLTAVLRSAWDNGDAAPLTKSNRIKATDSHVCIVAHITLEELAAELGSVDIWNGFANRFVWVSARRAKLVSRPKPIDQSKLIELSKKLAEAIKFSRSVRKVEFDSKAEKKWDAVYASLSEDKPGKDGAVTARAEAQVLRIALIFALLDKSTTITTDHLASGLAVWQFCDESARYIFGDSQADPIAAKILAALAVQEMSLTDIHRLCSGHTSGSKLNQILADLEAVRKIKQRKEGGGKSKGRPTRYFSLNLDYSVNTSEISEIDESKE